MSVPRKHPTRSPALPAGQVLRGQVHRHHARGEDDRGLLPRCVLPLIPASPCASLTSCACFQPAWVTGIMHDAGSGTPYVPVSLQLWRPEYELTVRSRVWFRGLNL